MSHKVKLLTSLVSNHGSFVPGDLYECHSAAEACDLVARGLAEVTSQMETPKPIVAPEKATVDHHPEKIKPHAKRAK